MDHDPDLHDPSGGGREEEWAESQQGRVVTCPYAVGLFGGGTRNQSVPLTSLCDLRPRRVTPEPEVTSIDLLSSL
ncbi:hypothetical protein EYF80_066435 [Liparis tanakae]|uniref:Uncharacterized protein n=1 Tax=Liparis tanakae TaxID=230148 RepID=A0A4Z2E4A0_9TELE|nr:hypothetical protein EYF80_066435 [Liparis tanakae]